MKGVDLTPGSNGGFKKPQTTLSSVPVMTNIPSLSCGCEGSAEDLRLAQFRIFCSESEPKAILGQGKAPIFYGYPCTRVSYKKKKSLVFRKQMLMPQDGGANTPHRGITFPWPHQELLPSSLPCSEKGIKRTQRKNWISLRANITFPGFFKSIRGNFAGCMALKRTAGIR